MSLRRKVGVRTVELDTVAKEIGEEIERFRLKG